ncbi:Acyl-CoA thioester hydrolase YbgC [Anaerobiospirillum thomasii]|uniref:Acyl-CoA thioester hydrolase YbgC n=1 Tax=Anaerobiospirillum thomasii TaxID=179995 RepID=A0A2X0VUB9_9GAMM|nr:YbgC/FadM family acyl-CoA thioesterase [Anaerobiospirillum thomasii]SPT70019.1 Acyl-CoA thioester hydrolase YbgC [Anaerobiospirillum thomasii]SPT71340.1 Acyl-CoA thioester hydrolase YbgC [Anaerobiospirillum thomasii]
MSFTINARVYYEDTDAGGIVYHANYLKFTERARTDWLRQLDISQDKMLKEGVGFVISRINARFIKSARLDDMLTISCIPVRVRRVGISFFQQIFNDSGELLFEMECDIAYLDLKKGLPMRMDGPAMDFALSQVPADISDMRVK